MKMVKILGVVFGAMMLVALDGNAHNNYSIIGDGTVTDHETNLIWQQGRGWVQDSAGNWTDLMTWEMALKYCEDATTGGFTDWRMPNIKELQSLVDHNKSNPPINRDFFDDISYYYYLWSSTTYVGNNSQAWGIDLQYGATVQRKKTDRYYVKCVRGGR